MSFGELLWELTDLEQGVLATLDDRRPGAKVSLIQNDARTAEVPLSVEDPAVALADPMKTLLRCSVAGWPEPLFVGRLLIPDRQEGADQEAFTLKAVDPLNHLERACGIYQDVDPDPDPDPIPFRGPNSPPSEDQSQVMWDLIAAVSSYGHGIALGSLTSSLNRDMQYATYIEVGAALKQMTELLWGPDFEITPVFADDGTLAEFNTFYPRQGSDKSATIVFGFGHGNEAALTFAEQPDGGAIINRAVVVGAVSDPDVSGTDAQFGYVASHAGSMAEYGGIFEVVETAEYSDPAMIEAVAKGIIAAHAFAPESFDFTPDPDAPHVFGSDADYWMGDTVAVSEEAEEHVGRIVKTDIAEDEDGAVELKHSCVSEADASGITGQLYYLNMTGNE